MSEPASTTVECLPALLGLPDELLDGVISHLATPADTVYFSLTCRRAHSLARDSPVWRRHCLEAWRYWAPHHDLQAKLTLPPLHTDWRQLYVERVRVDHRAAGLFEALLLSQQGRAERMQEIAAEDYDVRDLLLRQKDETPDQAEDVLARRWHAEAILGMIQRARAVEIWQRLQAGEDVSLEIGLCAYDLFVLAVDRTELIEDVRLKLDRMAQGVRDTTPAFDGLSTRQRAILIAEYLNTHGLVGNLDPATYHALRNNFISIAVLGENHTSLPLQSVAIYCAIANRLGIDARASNVPGHVLAVVAAPPEQTLDGEPGTAGAGSVRMHMDPWRQSHEVTADELDERLTHAGIPYNQREAYINGADTLDMVLRTSRNMLRSVETARFTSPSPLDIEAAQYSALWSMFILGDSNTALAMARRRQCLHFLMEQFQVHFPEDSALIIKAVLPMLQGLAEQQLMSGVVGRIQEVDRGQKTQRPRGVQASEVKYRVGHYFKHKRFGYRGFITAWDTSCNAGQSWITSMGVDDLPRGREQPFYKIIDEDRRSRYVAEENIELLNVRPSQGLSRIGGRYFKRWDDEEGKFVSNIRDEFPED